MKTPIRFCKYHNNQNYLLLFDEREHPLNVDKEEFVKKVSQKFELGADTILFLNNSDIADLSCVFYDKDGTIASMCGNGMLCIGDYFKKLNKKSISVETINTIISLNLENDYIIVENVPIHKLADRKVIKIEDYYFDVYHIDSTFPQFVVIIDEDMSLDFVRNNLINLFKLELDTSLNCINFLKIDTNEILTYEKGVGFTDSCGTGTLACAYILNELSSRTEVKLKSMGGINEVIISNNEYSLKGTPTLVCKGDYYG